MGYVKPNVKRDGCLHAIEAKETKEQDLLSEQEKGRV